MLQCLATTHYTPRCRHQVYNSVAQIHLSYFINNEYSSPSLQCKVYAFSGILHLLLCTEANDIRKYIIYPSANWLAAVSTT